MLFQKLAIINSLKLREFLTNGGAPIGAYEPEWFMADLHISTEDSVKAFLELEAKQFVPMPYGAHRLADKTGSEVLERFNKEGEKRQLRKEQLKVLLLGETFMNMGRER